MTSFQKLIGDDLSHELSAIWTEQDMSAFVTAMDAIWSENSPYEALFQSRVDQGYIKRCHGDLKASHTIADIRGYRHTDDLDSDMLPLFTGHFLFIDPIEFDMPSFYNVDICSDFALAVVDLEARSGMHASEPTRGGEEMVHKYLCETYQDADYIAAAVLEYYLVERAMVGAFSIIEGERDFELAAQYLRVLKKHMPQLQLRMRPYMRSQL